MEATVLIENLDKFFSLTDKESSYELVSRDNLPPDYDFEKELNEDEEINATSHISMYFYNKYIRGRAKQKVHCYNEKFHLIFLRRAPLSHCAALKTNDAY